MTEHKHELSRGSCFPVQLSEVSHPHLLVFPAICNNVWGSGGPANNAVHPTAVRCFKHFTFPVGRQMYQINIHLHRYYAADSAV
jgi:hypothetical protein